MRKLLIKLLEWLIDGQKAKKTKVVAVAAAAVTAVGWMDPAVLKDLKRWEGFRGKAYIDIAGHPTQGYGHTNMAGGPKVDFSKIWTEEYASNVLQKDLIKYRDGVKRAVKVPLNNCQLSVLTMWTYNVGVGAMRKSSLIRELNKGHYHKVPGKLMAWNKARVRGKLVAVRGLTNRRRTEGKLWKKCK